MNWSFMCCSVFARVCNIISRPWKTLKYVYRTVSAIYHLSFFKTWMNTFAPSNVKFSPFPPFRFDSLISLSDDESIICKKTSRNYKIQIHSNSQWYKVWKTTKFWSEWTQNTTLVYKHNKTFSNPNYLHRFTDWCEVSAPTQTHSSYLQTH